MARRPRCPHNVRFNRDHPRCLQARPYLGPYQDLAKAFEARDQEQLRAVASRESQAFAADGNAGLVQQCIDSLPRKAVLALTRTYLTLSLEDIAKQVGLPGGAKEAEQLVLQLSEAGEIRARIDHTVGMVSFADEGQGFDSADLAARLDSRIKVSWPTDHTKKGVSTVGQESRSL